MQSARRPMRRSICRGAAVFVFALCLPLLLLHPLPSPRAMYRAMPGPLYSPTPAHVHTAFRPIGDRSASKTGARAVGRGPVATSQRVVAVGDTPVRQPSMANVPAAPPIQSDGVESRVRWTMAFCAAAFVALGSCLNYRRGHRIPGPNTKRQWAPAQVHMAMASVAGDTPADGGVVGPEYTRLVIDRRCAPRETRLERCGGAPPLRDGEVLLRVEAVGLNALDWFIAQAVLRVPPALRLTSIVPGSDFCGVVQASRSRDLRPGDRVAGMVPEAWQGTYSETLTVPARHAVRVPPGVPLDVAAALPLAGLTAWRALRSVEAGARVLVIGAAGGVGHLAVQLAALRGAEVVGVASAAKHAFVRECGALRAIDYRAAQWDDDADRYDLVLDCVGANQKCRRSCGILRPGGRLVDIVGPPSVGYLSRAGGDPLWAYAADVRQFGRRVQYELVAVRADPAALRRLLSLVAEQRLRVHISRRWHGLADVPQAWARSQAGRTQGKSVLLLAGGRPGEAGPSSDGSPVARPSSCDTFVSCFDGTTVFGKNSDRPCDEVQNVVYVPGAEYGAGYARRSRRPCGTVPCRGMCMPASQCVLRQGPRILHFFLTAILICPFSHGKTKDAQWQVPSDDVTLCLPNTPLTGGMRRWARAP